MTLQPMSVFITGANRGIGLAFVKSLMKLPNPPRYVIGSYRNSENSQVWRRNGDITYTTYICIAINPCSKCVQCEILLGDVFCRRRTDRLLGIVVLRSPFGAKRVYQFVTKTMKY